MEPECCITKHETDKGSKKTKTPKKKVKKIEPFYDSDEGIAWGPITLREIKGDLKRQRPKINRRHSYVGKLRSSNTNVEHNKCQIEQVKMDQENSIPEISEYLTASERQYVENNTISSSDYLSAMETNLTKSSVYMSTIDTNTSQVVSHEDTCLNFVQRAMNNSEHDIDNEYHSLVDTFDNTCRSSTSKHDFTLLLSGDEEVANNSSLLESSAEPNDENYIILSSDDDGHTVLDKKRLSCVKEGSDESSNHSNIHNKITCNEPSLLEPSNDILSADEDSLIVDRENFSCDKEVASVNSKNINKSLFNVKNDSYVFDLHYLSDQGSEEDDDAHMVLVRKRLSCVKESSTKSSNCSNIHNKITCNEPSLLEASNDILSADEDSLVVDRENFSCDKEVSSENSMSPIGSSDQLDKTNFQEFTENSLLQSDISAPFSIPDIDLHQFNDSNNSLLDNTLDKINALLEQAAIADAATNKSKIVDSPCKNSEDFADKPSTSTCNIISASFLQKPIPIIRISPHEEVKTTITKKTPVKIEKKTPVKVTPTSTYKTSVKVTPTSTYHHKATSHIPLLKKSPEFRVPVFPVKKPLHPPKISPKSIVSPIRMYIKYSPKPLVKRNVNPQESPKMKINALPETTKVKGKENHAVLPKVVYTPAKKRIVASNQSMHLPGSVDKLVKKAPVTKHERLTNKNLFVDETLDHEAELTKSVLSDSSTFSETDSSRISQMGGNTSILHTKSGFRK